MQLDSSKLFLYSCLSHTLYHVTCSQQCLSWGHRDHKMVIRKLLLLRPETGVEPALRKKQRLSLPINAFSLYTTHCWYGFWCLLQAYLALHKLAFKQIMQEVVKQRVCACRLHDRMPVLLTSDEHAEAWLGTEPLSAKYVGLLVASMLVTSSILHTYHIFTAHLLHSMYNGMQSLQATECISSLSVLSCQWLAAQIVNSMLKHLQSFTGPSTTYPRHTMVTIWFGTLSRPA